MKRTAAALVTLLVVGLFAGEDLLAAVGDSLGDASWKESLADRCERGLTLEIEVHPHPLRENWDPLVPFAEHKARPDPAGSVRFRGAREAIRKRNDTHRLSVPLFSGRDVILAGDFEVELFDRDPGGDSDVIVARQSIDVEKLVDGIQLGAADLQLHCR